MESYTTLCPNCLDILRVNNKADFLSIRPMLIEWRKYPTCRGCGVTGVNLHKATTDEIIRVREIRENE